MPAREFSEELNNCRPARVSAGDRFREASTRLWQRRNPLVPARGSRIASTLNHRPIS
jgi:hypothetical protein